MALLMFADMAALRVGVVLTQARSRGCRLPWVQVPRRRNREECDTLVDLYRRANVPTTAVPFYLIFCALLPIVATHQEKGWRPRQPATLRQGGFH